MSEPIVITDELTKRYGHHTAVDAVSLTTVRRGEIYGFLGPTGAARSPSCGCCWGWSVHPGRGANHGRSPRRPAVSGTHAALVLAA